MSSLIFLILSDFNESLSLTHSLTLSLSHTHTYISEMLSLSHTHTYTLTYKNREESLHYYLHSVFLGPPRCRHSAACQLVAEAFIPGRMIKEIDELKGKVPSVRESRAITRGAAAPSASAAAAASVPPECDGWPSGNV